MNKISHHSFVSHVNDRCGFTSKAASCLSRWRLSRHVWRDLADYNQMSGVIRARWGTPTRNSATFTFKRGRRSWLQYDGMRTISVLDRHGETQRMRFRLS
jgi:ribosomal protein S14